MNNQFLIDMWLKYLGLIIDNPGSQIVTNPAQKFTKETKIGIYDRMPDEEYNRKKAVIELENNYFEGKLVSTSYLVFLKAFSKLQFTTDERMALAETLATASARTSCGSSKKGGHDHV